MTPSQSSDLDFVLERLAVTRRTDLILRDAVDTHGGDGCEHHSDGHQAEELAGDGVAGVLQRQPQTLPQVPTAHLLKKLYVSARCRGRR